MLSSLRIDEDLLRISSSFRSYGERRTRLAGITTSKELVIAEERVGSLGIAYPERHAGLVSVPQLSVEKFEKECEANVGKRLKRKDWK